jgi:hypothetical protein
MSHTLSPYASDAHPPLRSSLISSYDSAGLGLSSSTSSSPGPSGIGGSSSIGVGLGLGNGAGNGPANGLGSGYGYGYVPPVDELEATQVELLAMKKRALERGKKAERDLKVIEGEMKRMRELEKGKAKAAAVVTASSYGNTPNGLSGGGMGAGLAGGGGQGGREGSAVGKVKREQSCMWFFTCIM